MPKGRPLYSLSVAVAVGFFFTLTPGTVTGTSTNDNGESSTTLRAIVHVGPRKTGSTAIQSSLQSYRENVTKDNYLRVPNTDAVIKCLLKDDDCNQEALDKASQRIDNARRRGKHIFFSCEGLDKFHTNADFAALDELMAGFDIRIVVVYRRFFDWISSLYGQAYRCFHKWDEWSFRGKRGDLSNIVDWLTRPQRRVDVEHDTHFSTEVFRRYRERGYNATLLNMYAGNGNVVENFFCDSVHDAFPHTCEAMRSRHIAPARSNAAESLEYDEIAVAALDAGVIDGSRISRPDAREAIRKKYEVNIGLSVRDLPRLCPSESVLKHILDLSIESEREYLPSFFSDSEEESLGKMFEEEIKLKFCSVDVKAMLSEPQWRGFLLGLGKSTAENHSEQGMESDVEEDE